MWARRTSSALFVLLVALSVAPPASAEPPGDEFGAVDTTTGRWYLRQKHDPYGTVLTYQFYFGLPGDVPIVGDWDCDGFDTPGVFRPSTGYIDMRNDIAIGEGDIRFYFGDPGDIPIPGDFDGDGCDTVSVYRPSEGRVFVVNRLGANDQGLGAADYSFYYGVPLDMPFAGDFDGDGIDTVGLHRESTGQVFLRNSNTPGPADVAFYYGNPGDRIIAGDWAQRGESGWDTVGVFRPYARTMHLRFANTPGASDVSFLYGNPRTVPVAGHFEHVQGGPGPPLDEDLSMELSANDVTGKCEVTLRWGDWRGPLYASVGLWEYGRPSKSPPASHSGLITRDGTEPGYRHVFDLPRSTYAATATIARADATTGERLEEIGSPDGSSLETLVTCG